MGEQRRNFQEGEGKPRARGPRAKGRARHTKLWGGGRVLALILRKPGKLGLVFWNRELSGSGRDTRFHRVRNGWMGGKEEETVRLNSR